MLYEGVGSNLSPVQKNRYNFVRRAYHLIAEAVQNDETFTPMSGHEHVLARMCRRADGDGSPVGSQIYCQNVTLKLEEKKVSTVYWSLTSSFQIKNC